jgi:hypothetical protein
MTNSVLSRIGRFLQDLGDIVGTPSGDARGHVREYPKTMRRDGE